MLGIDPSIVVHEIKTYPHAKPIRQCLCPVHPRKAAAIKGEVEKLLKVGFIFPIPLTYWVSNIVPVTKKKEFDLVFTTAKSKKSLVFAELICSLPPKALPAGADEQLLDETLFPISTLGPWYGDIIMYLQTSTFQSVLSKDDCRRIHHHSQPYRIIGNTLYHVGVDYVLGRYLMIKEAERYLNDCHSGACEGHMSSYATT
eukprot:PITA_17676